MTQRYTRLDPSRIIETAARLERRVTERFPEAGLGKVAGELLRVASDSAATARAMTRPHWAIRIAIGCTLLLLVAAVAGTLVTLETRIEPDASIWEVLQGVEAGINDVVLLGAGVFFLVTWERRLKRGRALRALHQLRSLAHVIDMHQLTKDPERAVCTGNTTPSSPQRTLSIPELVRYLDYCSELLAIIGKIAALWSECLDDSVALAAVNEIEALTSGMSQKIWQKIVIAGRFGGGASLVHGGSI